MESKLGWILSGPVPREDMSSVSTNVVSSHTLRVNTQLETNIVTSNRSDDLLVEQVKQFWELESIGVLPNEGTVHDKFLDSIHQVEGRYEVNLPWKEHHRLLPDNYEVAISRLNSVLKRLKKTPELLQEYNHVTEEQSARGIVSDVDLNAPVAVGKLHYLPHHPVIRADKDTTKVRIVYDASCKSTGPSLNDCLHSGPSLISEIPDVLVRFRYHKVALVSDIEKAFLMVQVAELDRDVLRFLWVDDPNSDSPKVIVKRFNRVVFGVTSSPFLLNGTVQHHIVKYATEDPQFAQDMLSSLYVDDFNGGKSNVSEAVDLYRKTKSRMKDGNFNVRKWNSNSRELTELIRKEDQVDKDIPKVSEEDETYARTNLGDKIVMETTERKVLGLIWNHFEDHFIFEFNFLIQFARELPLSKRLVLKVVAKLYDPLGLELHEHDIYNDICIVFLHYQACSLSG